MASSYVPSPSRRTRRCPEVPAGSAWRGCHASCPGPAAGPPRDLATGPAHAVLVPSWLAAYLNDMDESLVGSGYADHLTDADLALLASVAGTGMDTAGVAAARLRRDPAALPELISDARVFEAVFGDRAGTQ